MLQKIGAFLDRFFHPIEIFSHKYLLAPFRWLLAKIDPLSEKVEGTLLKKILQITIFPLFIILTLIIGFKMVEGGFTSRTFFQTIIMFLILGAIFAPLERLIPYSKKWLNDEETPTDIMIFFGSKLWGDYINGPIRLATMAIVVQEISPAIGVEIWPTSLHPILQVFLLLTVADFFRYWYHRWMHESEFMWRWHAVHHSSERLYWFNGTRSHPLEYLISGLLWAIPFAFIKAPVEIVFVTGLMGRVIGRFQHTNIDVLLGPFDYIFSSPKNHRYHHSKKIHEGNSNYGGDVIIWDHLFGTFHMPKGEKPSDDIGINGMPNYPKTFIGLMLAPFTYGSIKKEAEGMGMKDSEEICSNTTKVSADK
ncbi:MAG: sterol desaturase family protein [Maribacter sp.]